MTVKLNDIVFEVRVPNVNIEVETNTDNNLVSFRISKLSNSSVMSSQYFTRCLCIVIKDFWLQFLVFKVLL